MKIAARGLFAIVLLLCYLTNLKAQNGYFYTGKDYGSESTLSPFTQILNGGFDMLQTQNYPNTIRELHLKKGVNTVFRSLTQPRKAINTIGWSTFANSELIPFGFSKTTSQWIPNYGLHLIGGGMEYARMSDYYAYHNFKYPRIWAAFTSLTEQYLNP